MELLIAVLCIPAGLVFAWLSYRKEERNPWGKLLRTYIMLTISFAGIYYVIYFYSATSYAFSAAISSKRDVDRMVMLYGKARNASRRLNLLMELRMWINSKSDQDVHLLLAEFQDPWLITRGLVVSHRESWEYGMPVTLGPEGSEGMELEAMQSLGSNRYFDCYIMEIADKIGIETWKISPRMVDGRNILALVTPLSELSRSRYVECILEFESKESEHIKSASAELRKYARARSLSLIDFFYFSVITVTTLGYGDMVPNSTLVRLIVVSQILLGLYMLIQRAPGLDRNSNSHIEC